MKKITTIALTIALVSLAANASIMLDYTASTVDVGGVTYNVFDFKLTSAGDPAGTFATTSLTFTGDIQQSTWAGSRSDVHVHYRGDAGDFDSALGNVGYEGYEIDRDTYLYNGWEFLPPNDTNLGDAGPDPETGEAIVMSLGSGLTTVTEKDLVRVVALGNVSWSGGITFTGYAVTQINGVTATGPVPFDGDFQNNPIMPTSDQIVPDFRFPGGTTEFTFAGVSGEGRWFDPPLVPAYKYETDGNSNFTSVILPVGVDTDGQFLIEVTGQGTRPATEGVAFDFSAHFTGDIDKFWVLDIDPLAESTDPGAFPTFLAFDQTTVTFTQIGVPEPATMSVLFLGAMGLIARKRRRS